MSDVPQTIATLRAAGFDLRIVAGRLQVEPRDRISPEIDKWFKENARAVKSFLATERRSGLPQPNMTPIPDLFFDEIMVTLTDRELRIMLYVMRRTFGFKKEEDSISVSQFCSGICTQDGRRLDRGTGMSRDSVIRAVHSLERQGLLEATRKTSVQHGNESNRYRLKLQPQ